MKHIVRPDRTVGDADAVQCLQRLRDGPQHQVQQFRLPPRAWIGGDGRAGRRGADHEIAGSALTGGADAVGDRAQNSIHLGRQYLQGQRPGRQITLDLHRHQPRPAGDREARQPAAGAGQGARQIYRILAVDQQRGGIARLVGSIGRQSGRGSGHDRLTEVEDPIMAAKV